MRRPKTSRKYLLEESNSSKYKRLYNKESDLPTIKLPTMRGFLVLFFCTVILGCKNSERENAEIEIENFSIEELEYPAEEVSIPDTFKEEYLINYFLPWKASPEELMNSLDSFPGKDLSYLEKYLNDDEWYGENKRPHKRWQRKEIVNNVDLENFPNILRKGIITRHTDLRRIPAIRPGFDKYSKAGEGYPFDYFQETGLWANTPVLIVHASIDNQWYYIISPYYKGWVQMHDVAFVDEEFVKQWSEGPYCLPVSDGIKLQSSGSNYAINTKIGMVLPFEEVPDNPKSVTVYFANSDENQNAKILRAEADKSSFAMDNFKFDENNLRQLVSNLIGRPYGWGGHLENRDCSSLIRDLFGTFRIWLPRDSGDQMEIGHKYDFPDKTEDKVKLIKQRGIPFLTILRKKGHNMLYVGDSPNGEPLILHAIWGLKTSYFNEQLSEYLTLYPMEGIHRDQDGKLVGRLIIGETIITSTNVGLGHDGVTSPIEEIYAMTNILED